MQLTQVVLGKQSEKNSFVTALKSCEQKKKIPLGYIDYNQIKFLPNIPFSTEGGRTRNFDIEAKQIRKALREAERAVIVDANSLENALALINEYKGCWNITDEVIDKLYLVVHERENPDNAEVVQGIKEAFKLLEKFDRANSVIFITASGHAFNFAMDLAACKKRPFVDLPGLEKIVEINPEEAWDFIRRKIVAGKTVFVHETLLRKNPTVQLMPKSLTEGQRGRLNFIKGRKKG